MTLKLTKSHSASWLSFNTLVASAKRGYITIDVRSKVLSAIHIEDRLPFPLLENHGPDTIICATQSGCLLYNDNDKLSTVSIQLEEPPLSIKSSFPWAVAGTSGTFTEQF